MRRTVSVLFALILLFTIVMPVSARHEGSELEFQAEGELFVNPAGYGYECGKKQGDFYASGIGELRGPDGSLMGGYVIQCEVIKIIKTTPSQVRSRLLEGTMVIMLPTEELTVRYRGFSRQELVKPKETPYGPAQLWWKGKGRVIASSMDDSEWVKAEFEWDGYIPASVDLQVQPAPFQSAMRLTAKGR